MKAAMAGGQVSPVNMEERRALGIRAGDTVRVHQKIQDKGKIFLLNYYHMLLLSL